MNTKSNKNKALIVDAMNLFHRSYYGYPKLTSKEGVPTGGFFGFVKYLKSLNEKFQPKHIIVCSDAHRISFRNEIYPAYKGTRKPTDENLRIQFPFMEKYLEKCNIKFIKKENYEADDLIGTLAMKAKNYGYVPHIVSGDKDLFQVVREDIFQLYLSNKGVEFCNADSVAVRYGGLDPSQIVDLKALSGDSSDNIPGVNGVGEKTAIKLLNKYRDLDGIYLNIDKLKGKIRENLIKDKEIAYISKELATIDCNVDINTEYLFTVSKDASLYSEKAVEFLRSLNIYNIYNIK